MSYQTMYELHTIDKAKYNSQHSGNRAYRLGDIFKFWGTNKWGIHEKYIRYHVGTLGYEYTRITKKANDIDAFVRVIQSRKPVSAPDMSVHLRLGDCLLVVDTPINNQQHQMN